MSWGVRLVDDNDHAVEVDSHQSGGTVAMGGSTTATCSVTWNYSYFYYKEIDKEDGFMWLDGKKAADTIEVLERAVEALDTEPHSEVDSYWIPSLGNAGKQLVILLQWAKEHPDATWRIRP